MLQGWQQAGSGRTHSDNRASAVLQLLTVLDTCSVHMHSVGERVIKVVRMLLVGGRSLSRVREISSTEGAGHPSGILGQQPEPKSQCCKTSSRSRAAGCSKADRSTTAKGNRDQAACRNTASCCCPKHLTGQLTLLMLDLSRALNVHMQFWALPLLSLDLSTFCLQSDQVS